MTCEYWSRFSIVKSTKRTMVHGCGLWFLTNCQGQETSITILLFMTLIIVMMMMMMMIMIVIINDFFLSSQISKFV